MQKRLFYKVLLIAAVTGLCAYFAFPLNKRINLGLDLQGGMHLLLKVDTSKLSDAARADAADRAVEVIRNRIDAFGVREPSIVKQGEDEIVVQLPGITERQRAIDLIGKTALLEFELVSSDAQKIKDALAGTVPEGYELKRGEESGEPLLLEKKVVLTGDALTDAEVRFQGEFNQPVVSLKFNADGAKKFSDLTTAHVGQRLAIVLDGKVQSAPVIREAITTGEAVISGRFTVEEAQDLALVLRIGALPAPMHIEEERTVGPLLGQDSINKGVKASIYGLAFVLIFMAIYYFLSGLIADIALMLNLLMILGCLGLLPHVFPGVAATLTLPGIAGIVLSLGMAVDANVLINERIREELIAGRSLRAAIDTGYHRAFSAILDSHMTNLIAAYLLFQFGTGPIRGFAVTLTIGVISSLFTAIVVTRTIIEILMNMGWVKTLHMLRLIKNTKVDFISKRRIFYALSIVVTVAGLGTFFMKGPKAYGIDFTGGQIQEYSFKTPPSIDVLRTTLDELNLGTSAIQQFKENPRIVLIRTSEDKNRVLTDKLKSAFPDQDIQVLRIEHVGPIAGKHLKDKAVYAILWSLVGICIYIGFRFKNFEFAIAGIIGLFHDVLVALGFLAMTGRPVDLLSVTALLTIAGYSISDTIVVFDRVRENRVLYRKLNLYELINLSVNQCLGRTILTTGVTLLSVLAIFLFGGEVLSNFSFALLIGFFCGVYSTVYITAPLVLAWTRKIIK
jgi:SecD/SecF fusion protein